MISPLWLALSAALVLGGCATQNAASTGDAAEREALLAGKPVVTISGSTRVGVSTGAR